ncbi:MAG TPA: hypothetical protein VGN14_11375 [Candidatus Elarobacter sp.]
MIERAVPVAVALVCLAAAVVLVRTRLPLVIKLIGAVVFLYGASVAAPLPPLPWWLRAAVLDSLAILPLAMLVALVLAAIALFRRRFRSAGLLVVLALAAFGCRQLIAVNPVVPVAGGGAPCPDPTVNPLAGIEGWAPGAGHANQLGSGLGGAFGGGGNAAANATPKPAPSPAAMTCTIDPTMATLVGNLDQLAAKVPLDGARVPNRAASLTTLDAAYAYVRDGIATEPYAGAMRGAFGTLMARAGSSADKALLLAALLDAQHVPIRYARATLADTDVDLLLRAPAAPPDPGDGAAADPNVTAIAGKIQAAENAQIDAAAQSAAPLVDDLFARAGIIAANSGGVSPLRAALRTHWWVQAQRDGGWVDLDPALPSTPQGSHLGANPTTFAALPDDAYATLTVRIFLDRGGAKASTPALTVTRHITDLAGTPVVAGLGSPDAKVKDLASVTSAVASMTVGGQSSASDAIPLAELDAVRLELAVAMPGDAPRVARRTLYHRVAGDARTVAAAATVTETMLVTTGDYDTAFIDRREIENVQSEKPLLIWATEHRSGPFPAPPAVAANAFPIEALRYAAGDQQLRTRLAATLVPGGRFVFARPSVAAVRKSLRLDGKTLRGRIEFDVVDDGVTVAGGDAAAARRANAIRGAIGDTVERRAIGAQGPGATRALVDAAKAANVPLVVVAPAAGDPTTAVAFDGDARAQLSDLLAEHQVAIAPQRPVALDGAQRAGWWALDPATGDLVGRMDDGAGQAKVEYVLARLNDDMTLYTMIQFYADFFRCIAMGVEQPLSGTTADTLACMQSALCSYLEAMTYGFGIEGTLQAFIYSLLDITFYKNTPGLSWKTSSWTPAGAACGKFFPSSFS